MLIKLRRLFFKFFNSLVKTPAFAGKNKKICGIFRVILVNNFTNKKKQQQQQQHVEAPGDCPCKNKVPL